MAPNIWKQGLEPSDTNVHHSVIHNCQNVETNQCVLRDDLFVHSVQFSGIGCNVTHKKWSTDACCHMGGARKHFVEKCQTYWTTCCRIPLRKCLEAVERKKDWWVPAGVGGWWIWREWVGCLLLGAENVLELNRCDGCMTIRRHEMPLSCTPEMVKTVNLVFAVFSYTHKKWMLLCSEYPYHSCNLNSDYFRIYYL